MSSSRSDAGNGGLGITGVLFLIFLVLKLTGHIDWSWWWVTSPLWIGLAFWAALLGSIAVVGALADRGPKAPPRFDEVDQPFVKPNARKGGGV